MYVNFTDITSLRIQIPYCKPHGNSNKPEYIIIIGLCTVGGDEKGNEITAVPELLDLVDVEGAIVTADAISCQKKIVSKIIDKKADYTIGLKNNQPVLHTMTQWTILLNMRKELTACCIKDKGHRSIEKREYRLLTDISWLEQQYEWEILVHRKPIALVS